MNDLSLKISCRTMILIKLHCCHATVDTIEFYSDIARMKSSTVPTLSDANSRFSFAFERKYMCK